MQILRVLIVIAALLACATPVLERVRQEQGGMRDRLVDNVKLRQVTAVNAATSIFHAGRVPGGIATKSACSPAAIFGLAANSNRLGDLLDAITIADPSFRWNIRDDVANLTEFGSEETLLDVVIARLNIQGEQTEDSVVSALLKTTEIEKGIMSLQLQEGRTEIGLRSLDRPGSPPLENKAFDIHLRDVSLRTALNTVARQHGTAVWHYDERRCNNPHEFSLTFLVW
jgi:hypothetical protein